MFWFVRPNSAKRSVQPFYLNNLLISHAIIFIEDKFPPERILVLRLYLSYLHVAIFTYFLFKFQIVLPFMLSQDKIYITNHRYLPSLYEVISQTLYDTLRKFHLCQLESKKRNFYLYIHK